MLLCLDTYNAAQQWEKKSFIHVCVTGSSWCSVEKKCVGGNNNKKWIKKRNCTSHVLFNTGPGLLSPLLLNKIGAFQMFHRHTLKKKKRMKIQVLTTACRWSLTLAKNIFYSGQKGHRWKGEAFVVVVAKSPKVNYSYLGEIAQRWVTHSNKTGVSMLWEGFEKAEPWRFFGE